MISFVQQLLQDIVFELDTLATPLVKASRSQLTLYRFLSTIGWDLETVVSVDLHELRSSLEESYSHLGQVALALHEPDAVAVQTMHRAVTDAIASLERLYLVLAGLDPTALLAATTRETAQAFAQDLAEYLLLLYLAKRSPLLFQTGSLFGLIEQRRAQPLSWPDDANKPLRYAVVRPQLNWMGWLNPNWFLSFARQVDLIGVGTFDEVGQQLRKAIAQQLEALQSAIGPQGLQGMKIVLDPTGISLVGGTWLPLPEPGTDKTTLALAESFSPQVEITEDRWKITWQAEPAEATPVPKLFQSKWISLIAPSEPAEGTASLRLLETDNGLAVEAVGDIGLQFSLGGLTGTAGSAISLRAQGAVTADTAGKFELKVGRASVAGDVSLGGAQGLAVRNASLSLRELIWPLAEPRPFPFDIELTGMLVLPNSSQISVRVNYEAADLLIESTGRVHLGNGIWLLPGTTGEPVLRARSQLNQRIEFAVNALFQLPAASGTETVAVAGALVLASDGTHWQIEQFTAALVTPGLTLILPGEMRLGQTVLSLTYANSRFVATLGGELAVGSGSATVAAALLFEDVTQPEKIYIDSQLEIEQISLFEQVHLFSVRAQLQVDTRTMGAATGRLAIGQATVGLFATETLSRPPKPDQFYLAVVGVESELLFAKTGLALTCTRGELRLPPQFMGPSGARATVGLASDRALEISMTHQRLAITGAFLFEHIGVRFEDVIGQSDFAAVLATARLSFSDDALPVLSNVSGTMTLPLLDDQQMTISFADIDWDMTGLPVGEIFLTDSVTVLDMNGLRLVVLGGEQDSQAITGLTVSRSGAETRFQFNSQLQLRLPVELLTQSDGDFAELSGAGQLTVTTAAPVPILSAASLRAAGTFHLGGNQGLSIENGTLSATNIQNLFQPTPTHPFILALGGQVTLPNGPAGGLENAQLIFAGDTWPRFDLDGISAGVGQMTLAGGYLPLSVTALQLAFDDSVPLPEKFWPINIAVKMDAEVNLVGLLTGSVTDLTLAFDDQGIPVPQVDGLHLDVPGLELVEGFSLGGGMALGGLDNIPENLVLAGKLGGKLSGAGVEALVALGITDGLFTPLGAALEPSLGPGGIPLGITGFLLTGVTGGVSFTGSHEDPDSLRSYVQVNENGSVESRARPAPPPGVHVSPEEQVTTVTAQLPGETLEFPCPVDPCPPPSVGLLYQPHPDIEHYPNRIIFKFTALDRATVDGILSQLDLSPEQLERFTPQNLAARVTDAMLFLLPGELTEIAGFDLRSQFQSALESAIAYALAETETVYDALIKAAYRGIKAPQATLKLTGTLSYVGVSAFLSVTGGVVLSPTAQSAGIVGAVNLLGIPVGQLRGFFTATSAAGNLDPSLCGDLSFGLGPLDLGNLRMRFRYGFDLVEFSAAFLALSVALSEDLATAVLVALDEVLFDQKGRRVPNTLLALEPQQQLAFVALLMQQPDLDALRPFLTGLFDALWETYDPKMQLCGSVEPKLFGLPLVGEGVGVSALVTKTMLQASFRFSPMALFSALFGNILPLSDQMRLSLRLSLPSPQPLIEAGIGAAFNQPPQLQPILEAGFDHLLRESVAIVDYELAPMGFRLVNATARLLMPDVNNHPARSGWQRPEDRPGWPSRLAVLLAARDVLGEIDWQGTAAELRSLPDLPDAAAITSSLREGYFPHGGLLGAGQLTLPRLFLDAPPVQAVTELLTGDINTRLTAGQTLLAQLTDPVTVGQMGFSLPAPNPPSVAFETAPTPQALTAYMQQHPLALKDLSETPLYPSELFFQGSLGSAAEPLQLLGLPVGTAEVSVMVPSDTAGGTMRVTAQVAPGSWLRSLVGQANLAFTISQPPPEPVDHHFSTLQAALRSANRAGQTALAQLARELPTHLPKVSLTAGIQNVTLPESWRSVLTVSGAATLHAYSLLYDYHPRFRSDDAVAIAKNFGGLVLQLNNLSFTAGPFSGEVPQAALAIGATSRDLTEMPALSLSVQVGTLPVPGLALESAQLALSTEPLVAQLVGEVESLALGIFRIEPAARSHSLTVRVDARTGQLQIDPARLSIPALGPRTSVSVHGTTPIAPFTFSLSSNWSAGLSIRNFAVENPFNPGSLLFNQKGTVRAHLRGKGRVPKDMTIAVRSDDTLTLLPNLAIAGKANGTLTLRGDGEFLYQGSHSLQLPQLSASGLLQVRSDATAHLKGTVHLGSLPPVNAELLLNPGQIQAEIDFGNQWIGFGNLLEVRGGRWTLSYPLGAGNATLTARQALSARVLGQSVANLSSLKLVIDPRQNSLALHATNRDWIALLPNLLELKPTQLRLNLRGANSSLYASGSLRALKRQGVSIWQINKSQSLTFSSGAFETVLLQKEQLAFLPTSGPVYRLADRRVFTRLILSRNTAGAFALALRDVGIAYGGRRRASAVVAANGKAVFRWSGTLHSNGLTYQPGSDLKLTADLLNLPPTVQITLPKGRLKSSFAGWPSAGYIFPARSTTLAFPPKQTGSGSRQAKSWLTVPGFSAAEYRVTAPRLAFSLIGEKLEVSLSGGVTLRSMAKRPNGSPWAEASTSFSSQITADGKVTLRLPSWPSLGDPYQSVRNTCKASARAANQLPRFPSEPPAPRAPKKPTPPGRNGSAYAWAQYHTAIAAYETAMVAYRASKKTYDTVTRPAYRKAKEAYDTAVNQLNTALQQCDRANPLPPSLPRPPTITIRISDFLKP